MPQFAKQPIINNYITNNVKSPVSKIVRVVIVITLAFLLSGMIGELYLSWQNRNINRTLVLGTGEMTTEHMSSMSTSSLSNALTPTATSAPGLSGIYLIGGVNKQDPITYHQDYSLFVYVIDPDTKTVRNHTFQHYRGWMNCAALANGSIIFSSYWGKWTGYGIYSPVDGNVTQIDWLPAVENYDNIANVALAGETYVDCNWMGPRNISICIFLNVTSGSYKTMELQEIKYQGCAVAINSHTVLWIGGWSNSVLWIDVPSATHKIVAWLPIYRYEPGCALLDSETVVICGGHTHYLEEKTAMCQTLTIGSWEWGKFPSMNIRRAWFGLVMWNRHPWAIGGFNNEDGNLASIEEYNGTSWTMSPIQLPNNVGAFGVTVIFDKSQPVHWNAQR